MKPLLIAAALTLGAVSTPAFAAETIIYTNGSPGYYSGMGISNQWAETNSFVLSSGFTITRAIFGGWTNNGDIIQTVGYGFSKTPSFDTSAVATLTYGAILAHPVFGLADVRNYEIAVVPKKLRAGTYWFTLYNASTVGKMGAYWDVSNGPSTAYHSDNGESESNYFQILGNPAAVVPEPATWAMMLLGFGMIGAAVRRQRKVTTRVSYAV